MNKYQEALDYFLNRDEGDNLTVTCDWLINAEALKELVDKETPMKPINWEYINIGETDFIGLEIGQCNNCDFETTEVHNYCSQCGRKIKWSDERE